MSDCSRDTNNNSQLEQKAAIAAKWSLVTQVVAKLISPVTQLVLAHLLVPEVFGIVATITMVISFAEMFSDAGFQKYLIQHDFDGDGELSKTACVAFWTNLSIASLLWILLILFNSPVAKLVGCEGLGFLLAIAGASLPLVAVSSVQTALYQRSFNFKILFSSRLGSAAILFFVAVPLAFFGFSYWSIVIGTILSNIYVATWLTIRSPWKPKFEYSFKLLKQMLSFSIWTLVEAFVIWITSYAGTFVLGAMMSTYYLGLYKTSISFASAIVGLATSALNPVIFSTLSRLQSDRRQFDAFFYRIQSLLGFVCTPLACCLLIFRDSLVAVLLGENWLETATFLGLYAASCAFVVVFCHTASEAYRALGHPKYSTAVQLGYLCVLIPSLVLGAHAGYETFSWLIPVVRTLAFVLIHFAVCKYAIHLSPWKMIKQQFPVYAVTAVDCILCMTVIDLLNLGYLAQLLVLATGGVFYTGLSLVFKPTRRLLASLLRAVGILKSREK